MQATEKIEVFIRTKGGKVICICPAGQKHCGRNCQRDHVTRDRFEGWEKDFHRNRYGKS